MNGCDLLYGNLQQFSPLNKLFEPGPKHQKTKRVTKRYIALRNVNVHWTETEQVKDNENKNTSIPTIITVSLRMCTLSYKE